MTAPAPIRLNSLQAGRAIAALMVVVFHANIFILPDQIYRDGTQSWAVFNFGYAGVEFFFALSGFIMVFIHRGDFGHPARVGRFLRKRVERISPVYWVVLAALVVVCDVMPGRGPAAAAGRRRRLPGPLTAPLVPRARRALKPGP